MASTVAGINVEDTGTIRFRGAATADVEEVGVSTRIEVEVDIGVEGSEVIAEGVVALAKDVGLGAEATSTAEGKIQGAEATSAPEGEAQGDVEVFVQFDIAAAAVAVDRMAGRSRSDCGTAKEDPLVAAVVVAVVADAPGAH